VADVGGWLVKYGSAGAIDAALDADPCLCHKYIEQGENLIQHKKNNPTMRLGKHSDILQQESVSVQEEKKQGLRKPKRKFMAIEAYEKKFGAADPSKIKMQKIDGESVRGVDVIAEEDIGVYEYIDETVNTVQRTTRLSDPDVVLSTEQNDIIFNATAKHLSVAPKDNASCILLSGGTSSSASASTSATPSAAKDTDGGAPSLDHEDGGSDDDAFQPFAALFGRLKPIASQAAKKVAPAAKATQKAISNPSCKAAAKAGKKRAVHTDASESGRTQPRRPCGEVHDVGVGAGAGASMPSDDQEVIDKYQLRLDELKVLDAASHDEAAFAKWTKEKLASLQELKQQIYVKKKSLKRRKDDSQQLSSALDGLMTDLTNVCDLLKKLSAGTTEGRQLVEMLEGMPDALAGPAIWMRAIRALAFANLKVMEWQSFFSDTYMLCHKHASVDPGFFSLLTSQLLQRLIKAIPCGKAVTADSIATVKAFMDELSAPNNMIKTISSGMDLDEHMGLISDLRTILDFSASPSSVEAAIARAKAHDSHWAAVAFALPQGKKVMDAAAVNAKNKGAAAGVLEKMERAENYLDKSGLCTVEAVFMVGMKDAFNAEHAKALSDALIELGPLKHQKVLKGADREKWCRILEKARGGVGMVIFACVANEILPYLERLRSSIQTTEMLSEPMLEASCALCHLADSCHGEDVLVGKLKDLNEFLKELNRRLCDEQPLVEKDAKTLTTAWASKSASTFACLTECANKLHTQGLDPECKLKECANTLAAEKDKVSRVLEDSLKGHLRDRSLTNVQECMLILRNAVLSAGEVRAESKENFDKKKEAVLLVSTVLGDEGNAIRQGMDMSCMLLGCMMSYDAVTHESDSADQRMTTVMEFLKNCKELSTVNYVSDLKEMNKSFPVSPLSDTDYEAMNDIVKSMLARKDTEFEAIVAYHKEKLDAAYITDADTEIPDLFMSVECYSDIKAEAVTSGFGMDKTKELSAKAAELEQAISAVEKAATDMGMGVVELIDLSRYKCSYRSAIRWLLTGNVLYILMSKVVSRAMKAGSGAGPKAITQMKDCLKTAADHDVELPQGIHACVTVICGDSSAATQAQPSHAVP
ncbi:unnamed protein product, partial [Symbiodinium necroappetens]